MRTHLDPYVLKIFLEPKTEFEEKEFIEICNVFITLAREKQLNEGIIKLLLKRTTVLPLEVFTIATLATQDLGLGSYEKPYFVDLVRKFFGCNDYQTIARCFTAMVAANCHYATALLEIFTLPFCVQETHLSGIFDEEKEELSGAGINQAYAKGIALGLFTAQNWLENNNWSRTDYWEKLPHALKDLILWHDFTIDEGVQFEQLLSEAIKTFARKKIEHGTTNKVFIMPFLTDFCRTTPKGEDIKLSWLGELILNQLIYGVFSPMPALAKARAVNNFI